VSARGGPFFYFSSDEGLARVAPSSFAGAAPPRSPAKKKIF